MLINFNLKAGILIYTLLKIKNKKYFVNFKDQENVKKYLFVDNNIFIKL